MRPFIVADTETVLINDIHVPYAAGYLVVYPGDDVSLKQDYEIEIRFSESHVLFISQFEDRSQILLLEFINSIEEVVKVNKGIRTVYFHKHDLMEFSF